MTQPKPVTIAGHTLNQTGLFEYDGAIPSQNIDFAIQKTDSLFYLNIFDSRILDDNEAHLFSIDHATMEDAVNAALLFKNDDSSYQNFLKTAPDLLKKGHQPTQGAPSAKSLPNTTTVKSVKNQFKSR